MKALNRYLLLLGVGLPMSIGIIGCTTIATDPAEDVVMCPKCETVWIETADPDDVYGLSYITVESTYCPDCHSAIATFFSTGELAHSCDTCGGELVHCTQHR